jgi:hypothetical protein
MTTPARLALALLTCGLVAVWFLVRPGDPGGADLPPAADAADAPEDAILAPLPLARIERAAAEPAATRLPVGTSASMPRDLATILAEAARAEHRGDIAELEARALEALAPPHGIRAVLALLQVEGFETQADAFAGACGVALLAAAQERAAETMLDGAPRSAAEPATEGPVLAALLDALPRIVAPGRARLTRVLPGLSVEDRLVLSASSWPRLLELQIAHPGIEDDLAALFGSLHRDVAGLPAVRLVLLDAVTRTGFPAVVVAALRGLRALDGAEGASIAADLLARGDLAPELRFELARFAGSELEPDAAIAALAEETQSAALGGMQVLGDRPEAAEALRARYSALVAVGAGERERTRVVFGMRREATDVLTGIAETDPSPRVREQALLTLTSSRELGPEAVELVHRLRHTGSTAITGDSALRALGNLVVRSKGPARERALELVREMASDPALPEANRARARDVLRKHEPRDADVPPDRGQAWK